MHQSIIGHRMRMPLDASLAFAVTGRGPIAHPALVWDLAIGQSTLATHDVIANVFYRSLRFHRAPAIGDTLHTRTEILALRQNRPRADRPASGMAVLRVTTSDQNDDVVLDFVRCAMLPMSRPGVDTGHADDLEAAGRELDHEPLDRAVQGWDLEACRRRTAGEHFHTAWDGRTWEIVGGDVVSNAPELARLTLNIAKVHHDVTTRDGRRLVYGGHTIGIALAQSTRAIPNLVTVVAWTDCRHIAPVHEGDTLHSALAVESSAPLAQRAGLVHLRSRVRATSHPDGQAREVLDWRFVGLLA